MLPIYQLEPDLRDALAAYNRLVIEAPTGSGKSTQVPQMLLDTAGAQGQILVLQPRRLAARMLARRVARERNVQLGGEVGYQVRFDDSSGKDTRIKYITEGILLRQMLRNPELNGISCIIFDEFHERHLYTDISLARSLQVQRDHRPDLTLIAMSATLDSGPLEAYLEPCGVLKSEGRTFPVTTEYIPPGMAQGEPRVWDLAREVFEQAVAKGVEGDVLIFMPGAYEIKRTVEALRHSRATRGAVLLPLHGEMRAEDQDRVMDPASGRKVVVSTNVAETSLTIDGIRFVIDSGLARIPRFDPHRGINTLPVDKISRASADQRAGRAGRTAPGYCFRLWTERDHARREHHEVPEIRRIELSEVVLSLKAAGIADLSTFPWFEAPDPHGLENAERLLRDLGALHHHSGAITEVGQRMLSFPVHPRYARMFLAAEHYRCVRAVALAAALTQTRSLLIRNPGKGVQEQREALIREDERSDLFVHMRAWEYARQHRYDYAACERLGIHAQNARQVGQLFNQFLDIADKEGLDTFDLEPEPEAVEKSLLAGLADQVAIRRDQGSLRCLMEHGRKGELVRESVVRDHPLFVAGEINEIGTSGGDSQVLLSMATAIEESWLQELFPEEFSAGETIYYDPAIRKVMRSEERRFRDLVLDSKIMGEPPREQAAALLAAEVAAGRLVLKSWDQSVEQWMHRVNCLAQWCPEFNVTAITEEDRRAILEQVCFGSFSYKQIKNKDVWPTLKAWLSTEQLGALDHYVPVRIELPGGRRAKVTYEAGAAPVVTCRIQDLWEVKGQIKIANGKIPIRFHICGPNQRPVHVTEDLANFWKEIYPRVKQEMQRKYPKHEWR